MIDPLMLDLFRTELETNARELESGLKEAGGAAPASLEPLARAVHSIKGAARMLKLVLAERLAHAMEDLLLPAHKGALRLTAAHLEVLERSNELFLRLASVEPARIPEELEKLKEAIEARVAAIVSPGPAAASDLPGTRVAEVVAPAAAPTAPAADPSLLDLFQVELENHARVLEEGLVAAEGAGSPEKLEPLMRAAHSIKGAARMVGLDAPVALAHAMEDVLSSAQKGRLQLTSGRVDALLAGNDVFLRLAHVQPEEIAFEAARQRDLMEAQARRIVDGNGAPPAPAAAPERPAQPQERAPAAPEDGLVRVFADNLNRLIGLSGECLVETESLKPLRRSLRHIQLGQVAAAAIVEQALDVLRGGESTQAILKLEEALRHFESLADAVPQHISDFDLYSHRLERLVNRLHGEAVASRMRPFSDGLQGFPRMVRDLSQSTEKLVRLQVEGESTRVDRDILEKLEAPLTHLLRNAVDHGVEPPAARRAAGKPEEGRIVLSARHSSGKLIITVADDGAGIDCERIRTRVIEKGYAPAAMARDLSNAELLEFLFLPGFTTKGAVSEISGRGVGLDIVQSMTRAVGGSVRVESTPGAGSTFQLQLPLTLSVLRGLLFEIAGECYAAPLARIDRVMRIPHEQALLVQDRQFCRLEGENLGIVDARQVLGLAERSGNAPQLSILVISDRLNRYGLVVDRFAGERDLVVVPFHSRLGKVPNLSAGAILEDGSPLLILDIEDVVRSIDNLLARGRIDKIRREEARGRVERKRILVVDDSLTVREVERRMLESRGYEVAVSVDGMDGLNAVLGGRFDLLITDVDMPRMDGIELVRSIRGTPRLSGLPVMIVSYKDQEEYRVKGLQAGANYYLTKSSFHEDGLFQAVRDLIGEP